MNTYMEEFLLLCKNCDDYTPEGVKKHNKAVRQLSKLYHKISQNKDEAEKLYDILMDNDDERVRATAAAHSLGMDVNVAKAKKTLKQIAQNSPEAISRFNAQATLDVWKQQGYLNF